MLIKKSHSGLNSVLYSPVLSDEKGIINEYIKSVLWNKGDGRLATVYIQCHNANRQLTSLINNTTMLIRRQSNVKTERETCMVWITARKRHKTLGNWASVPAPAYISTKFSNWYIKTIFLEQRRTFRWHFPLSKKGRHLLVFKTTEKRE